MGEGGVVAVECVEGGQDGEVGGGESGICGGLLSGEGGE